MENLLKWIIDKERTILLYLDRFMLIVGHCLYADYSGNKPSTFKWLGLFTTPFLWFWFVLYRINYRSYNRTYLYTDRCFLLKKEAKKQQAINCPSVGNAAAHNGNRCHYTLSAGKSN